jgi:hypothetical protein
MVKYKAAPRGVMLLGRLVFELSVRTGGLGRRFGPLALSHDQGTKGK